MKQEDKKKKIPMTSKTTTKNGMPDGNEDDHQRLGYRMKMTTNLEHHRHRSVVPALERGHP